MALVWARPPPSPSRGDPELDLPERQNLPMQRLIRKTEIVVTQWYSDGFILLGRDVYGVVA